MAITKQVFIVGPGFIGGEILDLLVGEGYSVRALVRRAEAAEGVKKSGAEPVLGGLHDSSLIREQTTDADIVIHTATADDMPSVEAILAGIKRRVEQGLSTIYLHNSGAAVFDDGAAGEYKTDEIWYDDQPERIDSVKDSAPHRDVDLAILKARQELNGKAKFAIVIPPMIYGCTEKQRLSVQIPLLARYAIREGRSVYVGQGKAVMSTVHVLDVARAYIVILHQLEKLSDTDAELANPYWFTDGSGDNEPSWLDVATVIGEGLHAAGKIEDAEPQTLPPAQHSDLAGPFTVVGWGLNSRTRSVRLAKLGWRPREKGWKASFLEDELPQLLKE